MFETIREWERTYAVLMSDICPEHGTVGLTDLGAHGVVYGPCFDRELDEEEAKRRRRMNPRDVTLLLGAEGCTELGSQPWLRAATEAEAEALKAERASPDKTREENDRAWDALFLDLIGRPYWLVTVGRDAPEEIWLRASSHLRLVRLVE